MGTVALVLVFLDALGKKREMRIDDPIAGVTEIVILAAMNLIITKNIFGGDALVSAEGAYIVTTTKQEVFSQAV